MIFSKNIHYKKSQNDDDFLSNSSWYSDPLSNHLLVQKPHVGLSCVAKYEDVYRRALINQICGDTLVLHYVDIGVTKTVKSSEFEAKHLIMGFSEVPNIAISCNFEPIHRQNEENPSNSSFYNQFRSLAEDKILRVESCGINRNGKLDVNIFLEDGRSLVEILRQQKLTVRVFSFHH